MLGNPPSDSAANHFLKAFKPLVFIGTMLGLFPGTGLLAKKEASKSKHSIFLPAYSISLFVFLIVSALLTIREYIRYFNWEGKHVMEKIGEFADVTFACSMVLTYGHQLFAFNRLRNIINKYCMAIPQLAFIPSCFTEGFPSFPVFCLITILSCMTLGVAEIILFDMQSLHMESNLNSYCLNTTTSSLGNYFCSNPGFSPWEGIVPPTNSVIKVIIIIAFKLGAHGWIFVDIIVITLCQALALNFQCLGKVIRNELSERSNPFKNQNQAQLISFSGESGMLSEICVVKVEQLARSPHPQTMTWESVLEKFQLLVDLSLETGRYVVPLILIVYSCILHILVILFAWIAPDVPVSLSTNSSHYVYYSSVYFCFRVGIVTYFASKVYHSSHGILETVERFSNSSNAAAAEKIERKLTGNPPGIRVLGTFLITRRFFVSIISFIFTTEIVFLQMANAIRPSSSSE